MRTLPTFTDASSPAPAAAERPFNWRKGLFFFLMAAYFGFLGAYRLPSVHFYADAVTIRDTGTMWDSLTWDISDSRYFLPAAVLGHIEGPFQFLFLNAYYKLVGDILPLDPLTTQLPNTVIALMCVFLGFGLCKRLYSERVGYPFGVCFALMPWLAINIRLPWVFNLAACLVKLTVLSFYTLFLLHPERKLYRVLAPVSLALYLTSSLGWPAFLFSLTLFVVLSGEASRVLRNPYNVFPAAVALLHVLWTAWLYYYGHFINSAYSQHFWFTIPLYCFYKVDVGTLVYPPLKTMVLYLAASSGAVFLAGLSAIAFPPFKWWQDFRGGEAKDRLARALLVTMSVWLVLFLAPLLKKANNSLTYAYVIGIPMAFMAAQALSRWKAPFLALFVLVALPGQWRLLFSDDPEVYNVRAADDRRVLAAAAFLIEERPDLLEKGKRALMPWNDRLYGPINVGQYARGQNKRIDMPVNYPATLRLTLFASGTGEGELRDLVEHYSQRGHLNADWVVLTSELLSPSLPAHAFYRRLADDPSIDWLAAFREKGDRWMWIGEAKKTGGRALKDAPLRNVDDLARTYRKKYDRISFLSRNARFIDHY